MLPPKILVTEDESIVAMDIRQRLEHLGFAVTATVSTGEATIAQVESNPPDLVLMDIQIKGDIDGIETAARIQEKATIPIVFLTANSDPATIERAKTAGPLAYLIKPFEDHELKAGIEIALYRHQLECELTDQKEWLRTTLSSIGDAVITTDVNTVITFLNPVAEQLTQWDSAEATGLPLDSVFTLVDQDTGQFQGSPLRDTLETGQIALLSGNTSLKRKDGSLVSIDNTAAPIRSKGNDIIGAVLVFHDVSDRRVREQKDRELQDKLEKAVWSRTVELSTVNEQLRLKILEKEKAEAERLRLQDQLERAKRMKALGLLAGGVAHDLNNMLGPLVGYPELILKKLPDDSPIRRQVERIGNAAKNAASVIQDLLTLARRGRYDMAAINPNQVITEYLDSIGFESFAKESPGIQLETILESEMPLIKGSAPHLSKVVMNLIVNAMDAMKDAGTLTIRTHHEHIDKLASGYASIEPGEYAIISVRDTGCGIQPEDVKKIFEPYYSKKEVKRRSGSGLGLSVVYGIVKDHHGYYDIFSEPGKGTEFILYFPLTPDAQENSVVTATASGGHETILVVDDNEGQRELVGEFLSALGYEVILAEHGTKAVSIVQSRSVDLVVLDMIMEDGFDGLDTYREILKYHPGQKAIIMSGFSPTARVDEAQKLGVGAYIKKPFEAKTLTDAVRCELDKTTAAVPS